MNAANANVALLLPSNQTHVYTPYLAQSVQTYLPLNQAGVPVTSQESEEQSMTRSVVAFSIKVVNPQRKSDAETLILKGVQPHAFGTLQSL